MAATPPSPVIELARRICEHLNSVEDFEERLRYLEAHPELILAEPEVIDSPCDQAERFT